jgi:tol-pal system protein YbgF
MNSPRVFGLALVTLVCLATAGPRAQSREQLQVMADMRILQEQGQQVRLAVAQLADQLKTLAGTLGDQAGVTTKQTADSLALVRDMQRTIDALGQQLSANTLQVQRFKEEIETLRQGQVLLQQQQSQMFQQLLTLSSLAPQTNPGGTPPAPPPSTGTPPAGGSTGAAEPLPSSPEALFHSANSQYIQQQYELAILGFQEILDKHPQSSWAPEAQMLIGMSLSSQGKYRDAVTAYAKVIATYGTSKEVPGAYFRQAQAYEQLKERESAIQNYKLLRDKYPNSTEAIKAIEALKQLGIGGEPEAAGSAARH